MEIQEKISRIINLFNQQKEVMSELNVENFSESIINIKLLEVQKEMVMAIPKYKQGISDELTIVGGNSKTEMILYKQNYFINNPIELYPYRFNADDVVEVSKRFEKALKQKSN